MRPRFLIALASWLMIGSCASAAQPSPTAALPTAAPTPTPTPQALNVYSQTLPEDVAPALRDVPSRVYVPNSKSNTVDVIDPETMRVIDSYRVGGLPHHVTPSWDMRQLYVNNTRGNTLTPIDPMTGKPGQSFGVDDPYNLYFTPDGAFAVVVAERERRLDFRDPHSWEVVRSVQIPYAGPNHLDFTADGQFLLVSCEFSGYVVLVDVVDMRVASALRVGGKPVDVRLAPDGSVFFVANETRDGVSVIDADSMSELSFIPTGAGTHGFVLSRSGTELYVTNRRAGSISVIDMATRSVVATWNTGGSPDMGGVSIDGTQLWVSERYHSRVLVVDTRSGEVVGRIAVGSEPHGLSVFPQPGRYSLGHTGNYR